MNSDEIEKRCKNCRFYEHAEGDRYGKCTNSRISINARYKMHAGWPDKLRPDSACGFFQPKI
jgi:hypothetical protein